MDKNNEEILMKIKKAVQESAIIQENLFEVPNRNHRTYSEEVIRTINKQLEENKLPIMVEEPNGERVLMVDPRLVYNPENSTAKIMSFSLVGTEIPLSLPDKVLSDKMFKEYKGIKL